jgi:hypothetical protein
MWHQQILLKRSSILFTNLKLNALMRSFAFPTNPAKTGSNPLPVANKKPGKAANCQTRKRNRKNESNEQHIASHFGGLYLEADDDAEKIKAFVVPNTSQDFL